MNGFEYENDDPYSIVSGRVLRIHLRSRLPDLQPIIQRRIKAFLESEIPPTEVTEGTPLH